MPEENVEKNKLKFTDFLMHYGVIYTFLTTIIGGSIAVYVGYDAIIEDINDNQEDIEITQMMILKPLVRQSEKNPCPISDAEWDEYLMNGSTLQDLKQKHKLVSKDLPFIPVKRIKERTEQCKD